MSLINNRYQIVRPLGQGGMGQVLLVEDLLKKRRRLALKMVTLRGSKDENRSLFENEFKTLTQLEHPNIAKVYDYGAIENENKLFFTTDYIEGQESQDYLNGKDFETLLEITVQLCQALTYLHVRNVIHFDIKPPNILIKEENGKPIVKIVDFGIALQISDLEAGRLIGTPHYLAPELIRKEEYDHRIDLFALGATLYKLISGQIAFPGRSPREVFTHILSGNYDKTALESVPEAYRNLVIKLLNQNPFDRFNSTSEVIERINKKLGKTYALETGETKKSYLKLSRLVGQEEKLNAILNRLKQSLPYGAVLKGEFGTGKSRFMSELKTRFQMEGISTIHYSPTADHQGMNQLEGFVQRFSEVDSNAYQAYETQLKELAKESGAISDSPRQTAEVERQRYFEACNTLLFRISRQRPLVLLIDDLNEADSFFMEYLSYLNRTVALEKEETPPQYLIVISTTPEMVSNTVDMFKGYEVYELKNFTFKEDVFEFITTSLGVDTFPPKILDQIFRISEGNPYFIKELLNALIDKGAIFNEYGDIISEDAELTAGILPDSLNSIYDTRLVEFNEEETYALRCLALFEQPISVGFLVSFAQDGCPDVVDCVEKAFVKGVVNLDRRTGVLRFSNMAYRKAVYDKLDSEQRPDFHRRAFHGVYDRNIQRLKVQRPIGTLVELAHQAASANMPHEAFRYHLETGLALKETLDTKHAVEYLEKAIRFCYEENTKHIHVLYETLAELYSSLGNYDKAIRSYSEILNLTGGVFDEMFKYGLRIATLYKDMAKYERSNQIIDDLMARIPDQDLSLREQAMISNVRSSCYLPLGQWDSVLDANKDLIRLFEEHLADTTRSTGPKESSPKDSIEELKQLFIDVYSNTGLAHSFKDNKDTALEYLRKALGFARECNLEMDVCKSLTRIGVVQFEVGNLDVAIQHYQEAWAIAKQHHHLRAETILGLNIANACQRVGKYQEAVDTYNSCYRLAKKLNSAPQLAFISMNLSHTYRNFGLYSSCLEYAMEAYEIGERLNDVNIRIPGAIEIAKYHIEIEDYAEAEKWACLGLELTVETKRLQFLLPSVLSYLEILLMQNRYSEFKETYHHYKPYIFTNGRADECALATHLMAQYEMAIGREKTHTRSLINDAISHFSKAEEAGEFSVVLAETWKSYKLLGELEEQAGLPEEALKAFRRSRLDLDRYINVIPDTYRSSFIKRRIIKPARKFLEDKLKTEEKVN